MAGMRATGGVAAVSAGIGAGARRLRLANARLDRISLALPMALMLGGAVAFALVAMPPAWLGHALGGPWLPDAGSAPVVPGRRVRMLIALAGALAGGVPVWLLFRWLERPMRGEAIGGRVDAASDTPDAPDHVAPLLRRADAHPDAPPRRPIFAAADLGAPLDMVDAAWTPSGRWSGLPDSVPEVVADAGAAPAAPARETTDAPLLLLDPAPAADAAAAPVSPVPPAARREAGSAAALLARLDAALAARPGAPAPKPGGALRDAMAELRKIGQA